MGRRNVNLQTIVTIKNLRPEQTEAIKIILMRKTCRFQHGRFVKA